MILVCMEQTIKGSEKKMCILTILITVQPRYENVLNQNTFRRFSQYGEKRFLVSSCLAFRLLATEQPGSHWTTAENTSLNVCLM